MKKRLLSLVMAASMLFGSAAMLPDGVFSESTSITASAETATSGKCGKNVSWSLDSNGVLTISGTGEMYNYYFEREGRSPFYDNDSIKSVVIKNGVTSIGDVAFSGCTSLESIIIPDSVTSIGEWAFYGCSSLKSITIPNSVTSISQRAFYDCTSLASITIPNSVTSIGYYTFYDCTSLKSVSIPDSVTSIGDCAFEHCSSLESITIPNGVTSIRSYAFEDCSSLERITIPDSVTSIGDVAFSNCTSLKSVNIPDNVKSIGAGAFYHCTSLASITIPDSVTSIGCNAFMNCTSLKSITIPDSVTSVGDSAFEGCEGLKSVTIPGSVTSIGNQAFGYYYGYEKKVDGFKIYCYKDSEGERYAKRNGFDYEIIYGETPQFYGTYINEPVSIEFLYNGIEHEYKYSDNYILKKANTDEPDEKVAKMLSRLAIAAYDKNQIVKCLSNMGFYRKNIKDYDSYSFMPTLDDNDRVAYSIAYKKIEGKNIFFIPIRGTHGNLEWISNFNLGTGDTHEGFHKAANIVKSSLMSEMKTRNVDSNNTILIFTGHSRGAAVANILAGEFSTSAMNLDGYSVDVPSDQIFAYTYACPAVAKEYLVDRSLNNIHNFNNPSDLIPALPLKSWGYARYGQTHEYRFDQKQAYAFTHYFYEMLGEDYKGYKDNSSLVSAIKRIANSKDSFNSRPNQFLFKRLALFMTDDDSEHLPCSKNKLEEDINNQYPDVSWCDLLGSVSGTFVYILLKQDVGVTTVLDAITHGHMGESYICLTDALFINNTSQGHSFIDSKTESVTISDSVTSIGDWAFYGCNSLESVTIPDSVTSIGNFAFDECTMLTSITIPDSVTSIEDYTFGYYFDFNKNTYKKVEGFTIYGVSGSAAETYATENGFIFINLNVPDGWNNSTGKWMYYKNGRAVTGWQLISSKWYFFNTSGIMVTGWQKLSNTWYFFNTSGAMVTGWQKIGNTWYFFNTSGAMVTGWQKIGNTWYFFNTSGAMVTGWQKLSNKWYYFNTSGAMVTGWQKLGNTWYFFNTSGAMVTGWQKIGGKWYYFESSGAMLANTSRKIGGKTYKFNASGACTNP